MKGIICSIGLCMLLILTACSGGGSGSPEGQNSVALKLGKVERGTIAPVGDVDIYRIRADQVNRYMLVKCVEPDSASGVDLLVTVYEEDNNGKWTRIFGKHKPKGGSAAANLELWIYINKVKNLVIEVKDLMADDSNKDKKYNISCIYKDAAMGNHDFANALELPIGADEAVTDEIAEKGQVDLFTFAPQTDGVYALNVDHKKPNGGSDVQLAVTLYDGNGKAFARVADPAHTILSYLESDGGPYYISIEDKDGTDEDAGAPYKLSVVSVQADETLQNDVSENADVLQPDAEGVYTATGAIDYGSSSATEDKTGDQDWYRIDLGTAGGPTTYHPLQMDLVEVDANGSTDKVRMTVYDAEKEKIAYHEFKVDAAAYTNQIRVENGQYFVCVEPVSASGLTQSAPYHLQLREVVINDPGEEGDDNTANSAKPLNPGEAVEGYVSYLADVDYYSINVNRATDQVLMVDLTSGESIVDYHISIWLGDTEVGKATERMNLEGNTHVKTSILLPADAGAGEQTYHIRVADAQNNEGSGVAYNVKASLSGIGSTPGAISEPGGDSPVYYSETGMEASQTDEVELEVFSNHQPKIKFNTNLLDFRSDENKATYQAPGDNGTTVITSRWISGYIDYDEDRDFFQLDFDKLDPAGSETQWYYDVEIQLVVPSATHMEYVWKLYHDTNNNNIVMDDPTNQDGYKACAGDTTPGTRNSLNQTIPNSETDPFWIGNEMGQGTKFFIGISDFNYLKLPETTDNPKTDDPNPDADADCSYEEGTPVPYYFRVKMVYHPGESSPN